MIVTRSAMRPASDKEACFRCGQPVGSEHKPDCVTIRKKVKVRMTVEYEISVPNHWNKEDIEFHRNEGTWCSSNAVDELSEIIGEDGCICNCTHFDYLGGDSEPFLAED